MRLSGTVFLFDLAWEPRERGDLARLRPELLNDLCTLWERWDHDMLPIPPDFVLPPFGQSRMLW